MTKDSAKNGNLGPLQQAVLDCIYEQPGCSVREVLAALNARGGSYAYTTVQTVCDALHEKRLVTRKREKLAYHYTAQSSKSGVLAQAFSGLLSRFKAEPQPVASSLVDVLESDAPEQLEALIAELKQRGKL
jgi:predicted transcriptional regulator